MLTRNIINVFSLCAILAAGSASAECFSKAKQDAGLINLAIGKNFYSRQEGDLKGKTRAQAITFLKGKDINPMKMNCSIDASYKIGFGSAGSPSLSVFGSCEGVDFPADVKRPSAELTTIQKAKISTLTTAASGLGDTSAVVIKFNFECSIKGKATQTGAVFNGIYNADGEFIQTINSDDKTQEQQLFNLPGCSIPLGMKEYSLDLAANSRTYNENGIEKTVTDTTYPYQKADGSYLLADIATIGLKNAALTTLDGAAYSDGFKGSANNVKIIGVYDKANGSLSLNAFYVPSAAKLTSYYAEPVTTGFVPLSKSTSYRGKTCS